MQPQYVRLIVSPNNNYPSNTLPRSTIQVKSTTPSIGYPASFSSIQILNGISTPTANKLPTRLILTSPPATCGISNGLGKQMKTSPTLQASSLATTPSPLYPVKSPLHKATFTPTLTSTDGCKWIEYNHSTISIICCIFSNWMSKYRWHNTQSR